MKHNFFESKYFIWCLVVVFGFALISLGREGYRYFQISEEIRNLEQKISNLKKENDELLKMRDIFNSSEFLEDEARKKSNMVKEGESIIIITDDNETLREEQNVSTEKISNLNLWLKYFFEK